MSLSLSEPTPPRARAKIDPTTLRALAACLATHELRLLAYARRRRATPQESEDALQEAAEAVVDGSRIWDGETPMYAFLCGIVRSLLSHRARAATKRPPQTPLLSDGDEMPTSKPDPEVVLAKLEELGNSYEPDELVAAARGVLVGTELAVFNLWEGGVRQAKEQAAALGLTASAVCTARRGIQRKLTRLVEERRKRT
jgi:DNA-directed RNA polymerase specialized sigma24 family protein